MRWDTIQCIRSTINVKNTTIKIVLEFLLWWLIMSGPYLRRWEEGDRSSRLKNDFKAETKCKTLNSKMICQLLVQMIFFFWIESVTNIFAKYVDVNIWNSWVYQNQILLSKCFNWLSNSLNFIDDRYICRKKIFKVKFFEKL